MLLQQQSNHHTRQNYYLAAENLRTARSLVCKQNLPASATKIRLRHGLTSAVVCCSLNSSSDFTSSSTSSSRTASSTSTTSSKTPSSSQDNPFALAFLGDAIWALYVRRHFFFPPKHYRLYHAAVRPFVTAEGQAAVYDALRLSKQLTAEEEVFLERVRARGDVKLRKRFSTAAAADAYRKATALEALVGHLHLHDPQRLEALVRAALPPPASPLHTQEMDTS